MLSEEEKFHLLVEDILADSKDRPDWAMFDETAALLVRVQGSYGGKAQWAYALMEPRQYLRFRLAERKGAYELSDYGIIVARGEGNGPADAVKEEMYQRYGAVEGAEELLAFTFERIWDDMQGNEEADM